MFDDGCRRAATECLQAREGPLDHGRHGPLRQEQRPQPVGLRTMQATSKSESARLKVSIDAFDLSFPNEIQMAKNRLTTSAEQRRSSRPDAPRHPWDRLLRLRRTDCPDACRSSEEPSEDQPAVWTARLPDRSSCRMHGIRPVLLNLRLQTENSSSRATRPVKGSRSAEHSSDPRRQDFSRCWEAWRR